MANFLLLLNTGDRVLLNTGDNVLLNDSGVSPGLTLSGTHSGVALLGPRPEQLIPIEFTFILKSCLITSTGFRICVKAVLEKLTKINIKLKSLLITETHNNIKLRSSLIKKIEECDKIQLKSTIWKKQTVIEGSLISPSQTRKLLDSINKMLDNRDKQKRKELLLRKLKEMMDEDE